MFDVPASWSDSAARICESRYARPGETSAEQIIDRMVGAWGIPEAKDIIMRQLAAPNSPQWFNTGVVELPQVHACFINHVEDNLCDKDGISDLWSKETRIFRQGSGSGVNVSAIREEGAPLSGGGTSSGVMSFLDVGDANAGAIKSGGTTRRAALMRVMDADHPDIDKFIGWKVREQQKVKWLVEGSRGNLDYDWRSEAYKTVGGQNSNNSVLVRDGELDIIDKMAPAAWATGDPGIMFRDTINKHNTAANDGEIISSNPCGEYLFLDNTACNLASINLANVWREGDFYVRLGEITRVMVRVLDRSIDIAGYPTEDFEKQTKQYRTIGLGITGLHEYLMLRGAKYSSRIGRTWAEKAVAHIRDIAVDESIALAKEYGPAPAWERNKEHMAREYGTDKPMRNMQLLAIAPTGTISFVMDAKSTGVEPVFSREIVKELVEGDDMVSVIEADETASEISPVDHLLMTAAVQKHVCGGVSKTINLPHGSTVEEVADVYRLSHELGLKCVTVYRDGSKLSQPLSSGKRVVCKSCGADQVIPTGTCTTCKSCGETTGCA